MFLNFVLWNHNKLGQRSLEDVIGLMGYQLRALGHTVQWVPDGVDFCGAKDGVNVIVEGFGPMAVQDIARAHGAGARFLCIATEEPTPKGFNHGTQIEMVARQKIFPEAAKYFDGILHLVPGKHVTDWYGQWAPAAEAELGWAPELERLGADRVAKGYDPEPQYDFGFYGSLSRRRQVLLRRLVKRLGGGPNILRHVTDFADQATRNTAMRQAKVILQIRKFEEMGLVSSSRCAMSLCLGRAVVGEPHLLSKPWDEIVHFSKTEDSFISEAVAVRACWRSVHASQIAKLREKMTPKRCVGDPLESIGFFERIKAAA